MDATDKPVLIITGSSGLIGSALVHRLAKEHRIAALDLNPDDDLPPGVSWIRCDLTDDESVEQAISSVREQFGTRIKSVIHLAAYYDFSGADSELYQELTVHGSRRLITALQQLEVEQFIFSSSLLVMKPSEKPLTERSPLEGEWAYPQSKIEAERVLSEHKGSIPLVVLRIAGVYDSQGHSIPIAEHVRRIYEKDLESFFFPGDASHGQAYIHLNDVVDCVLRVMERRRELAPQEVFLVAEADVMSYREMQEVIGEELHGKEWPSIRLPKALAKAGAWVKEKLPGKDPFIRPWMIDLADDHYEVELDRVRSKLQWEPKHSLRRELPAILNALRSAPRKWYEENKLEYDEPRS